MTKLFSLVLPKNAIWRYVRDGRCGLGFVNGRLCMKDGDTDIVSGVVHAGTPVLGVKATLVATSGGTAPANNSTITIGGQVYTFKTALTSATAENEVLIGVSAAVALDNLKAAINKDSGGGTTYGSNTVANRLFAATTNTNTEQTIEAKVAGVAANSYLCTASTDPASDITWATAGLPVNGVDCTPATKGEIWADTSKVYVAMADMTITSTAGWYSAALSAGV